MSASQRPRPQPGVKARSIRRSHTTARRRRIAVGSASSRGHHGVRRRVAQGHDGGWHRRVTAGRGLFRYRPIKRSEVDLVLVGDLRSAASISISMSAQAHQPASNLDRDCSGPNTALMGWPRRSLIPLAVIAVLTSCRAVGPDAVEVGIRNLSRGPVVVQISAAPSGTQQYTIQPWQNRVKCFAHLAFDPGIIDIRVSGSDVGAESGPIPRRCRATSRKR